MEARTMVVRVTSTEFELDNGRIFEMPIELEEVPTVEEFQKVYDQWSKVFQDMLDDREAVCQNTD